MVEYCKELEEKMAKRICVYVESSPCLYDQSNENYYTQKAKEKAFNVIADRINTEFQLQEKLACKTSVSKIKLNVSSVLIYILLQGVI